MKRLLAVAVAIAAVFVFTESNANAQGFANGYQFGTGVNSAYNLGFRSYTPREQLPYFAKFPPVYYSSIVARPVGISPYAAPPGIAPVEMLHAPVKSVTVVNPFFNGKADKVKAPPVTVRKLNQKTTMIVNPYFADVAKR